MTLAVRVSTLVAAFDRVAANADAMAEAATQFQDILQVLTLYKVVGVADEMVSSNGSLWPSFTCPSSEACTITCVRRYLDRDGVAHGV